jgi:guanine deaminase
VPLIREPARDRVLRGAAVAFVDDPFRVPPSEAMRFEPDAAVVIRAGRIADFGPASDVFRRNPEVVLVDGFPSGLLVPGFVDCHVHYAQLPILGACGHPLLEWLERYTFPAEQAFADEPYARDVARLFLDELLRNGTTTALVYCTVHPQSVEALFGEAEGTGLRIIAGKCLMDRNAPEGLTDTAVAGYDDSRRLLERWHGRGRLGYAVTPRFVATSSEAQLELAAALWREHPGTWLQSHLSENTAEVAWVRELYPHCADYVDVLDRFGLLGPRAVHGHGIHLSDRERSRLAGTGTALAHCPTSNLFLGSGLFDLAAAVACGVHVGLATDVGAGTTLSLLRTMGAAYQVARLRGSVLAPSQALWLATGGAAVSLGLGDVAGNLAVGMDADIAVLDLEATPLLAARTARCDSAEELLGVLMSLADDRTVLATFAGGALQWVREE